MKTRKALIIAALIAPAAMANADITVKFENTPADEYQVEYGYISDLVKPRAERPQSARDVAKPQAGQFVVKTLPDGPAQYVIPVSEREYMVLYTNPGDDLTVTVKSESPLEYTVAGTPLMESISGLDSQAKQLSARFRELTQSGTATPDQIAQVETDYNNLFKSFIAANPESPAVAYAVMNLDGQDFIDAYEAMTPEARKSPLMIYAQKQREYVEKSMEAERRKAQLQSGNVEAPDFTFEDRDDKNVSLSDFRGKWVIIDFWGSWCPWCIKGFPKLKEAYAQYKDRLEVVGVDCNDKRDAWLAAVDKYKLPWVNVYNPEQGGGKVLADYGVEGFPTKVIVTPEGKIANITSGENPEFFNILDRLLQ